MSGDIFIWLIGENRSKKVANNQAIAVLDTGAGGLSVVSYLRKKAPLEKIVYFADYAHLPYGLKSPELIKHLAHKACARLAELSECKIMLIACHTISVLCLKDLQKQFNFPVIGMLEPSILGLKNYFIENQLKSFGIISTKATLSSGAYKKAWSQIDPKGNTKLIEQACGTLVSLVEECSSSGEQLKTIIDMLLNDDIKQVEALMVGCTHFSALIPQLKAVQKPGCSIVDAADFVSSFVLDYLQKSQEACDHKTPSSIKAFVSDNPERFQNVAKSFMSEALEVELVKDW